VLALPLLLILLLLGSAAAVAVYAVTWAPYTIAARRHRIAVPANWPRISVLHLSDLHVSRGAPRLFAAQQAALERLPKPDLVCITGDLCEQASDVPLLLDLLRVLRPALGTFVILGNHEYNAGLPPHVRREECRGWRGLLGRILRRLVATERSSGAEEGEAIRRALEHAGVTLLINRGLCLRVGGRRLWLAGCDSSWAGRADVQAALRGRLPGDPSLVMVHEPELAFGAAEQAADLILAGHTHGGQVRLPVIGAPYTHRIDPRLRIAAGFQEIGEALLHVSAGLGHTVPLRLGVAPETVWLECVPTGVISLPLDQRKAA
jgi:uncharacterized protein